MARRIEHLGRHAAVSEALLGMVVGLAADGPEITSAVTALEGGQHTVGVGVVLGSNVFNLAALLGVGSIAAGGIALHRRVIALEGLVALSVALLAVLFAGDVISAGAGLGLSLVVLGTYGALISMRARTLARLPLPRRLLAWLAAAIHEENIELALPPRATVRHYARSTAILVAALVVLIGASIEMEHAGIALGARFHLSELVVGGLLLAAVTSLPNAVAALYLARRGRGTAVLSEAMNSNALNVLAGLFLPAVVVGVTTTGTSSIFVAGWYGAMTLAVLVLVFLFSCLERRAGYLIVLSYVAFAVFVVRH